MWEAVEGRGIGQGVRTLRMVPRQMLPLISRCVCGGACVHVQVCLCVWGGEGRAWLRCTVFPVMLLTLC